MEFAGILDFFMLIPKSRKVIDHAASGVILSTRQQDASALGKESFLGFKSALRTPLSFSYIVDVALDRPACTFRLEIVPPDLNHESACAPRPIASVSPFPDGPRLSRRVR
jgi:hypothetical protein